MAALAPLLLCLLLAGCGVGPGTRSVCYAWVWNATITCTPMLPGNK